MHFTVGDTAVIHVLNMMMHETSIHWHGLLLPNEQDGVPYLTTPAVKPMSRFTYRFVLRQSGTYWYHSHTMLQEQLGMYGAFIIHKKTGERANQKVLLLSDWTHEKPEQIERSLHHATDWYMIRKNAVQSYGEALKEGALAAKFVSEWKRMHAMDVSDVAYDAFLVNGSPVQRESNVRPGDTIRLRVINGSASTYFWLQWHGGKIRVVASDGMDIVPVEVDRLIVGVSETYDLEIVIPTMSMAHAFVATAEDRTGRAEYWFGEGMRMAYEALPRLNYFEGLKMMNAMMNIDGSMDDMGMEMSLQQMDMNQVMYRELNAEPANHDHDHGASAGQAPVTLNYAMLRAPYETVLPDAPVRLLEFELTGNMNRYVWTLNNKTISESDRILIEGGENIRIVIKNNSMMRHPMHLHGHFFRVLNGQGNYAPLKNVLDIMPMETDTIEFHASEDYGNWFFHCHILYHMMSGMGRIFEYDSLHPRPQFDDPEKAMKMVYTDDKRFYLGAEISMESNGTDGEVLYMNTRWQYDAEWRIGINSRSGYETESHLGRYLGRNQFMRVYTGWDFRGRESHGYGSNWFGQTNTKDNRGVICFGFNYTLPGLVQMDFRVDHTGNLRLQFKREDIALSKRTRLWVMYNSDDEYALGLSYILTKYIAASAHYDSDMGPGFGITILY